METFIPKGNLSGFIMPEFVLKLSITHGAKIMYSILCWHAYEKDHCWPSYSSLAKRMGCSINSIKNYFAELVKVNLVAIKRVSYHSSHYFLLKPADELMKSEKEKYASGTCKNELVSNPSKFDADPSKFDDNPPNSGYLNNTNETRKEIPTQNPARQTVNAVPQNETGMGVGDSFSDFEKVYEAYPRKEAKGLAKTAWRNLVRENSLPLLSVILNAIERFKNSTNWQRENGRFIPHLSNFLKGERWNDPLPDEEVKAQVQKQQNMEREKKRLEEEAQKAKEYEEKKAKVSPLFEAFAAKFSEEFHRPMVFGIWLYLFRKGMAPMAADVPEDNNLDIYAFIKAFERKMQQAQYLSAVSTKREERKHTEKPVITQPRQKEQSSTIKSAGEIIGQLMNDVLSAKDKKSSPPSETSVCMVA